MCSGACVLNVLFSYVCLKVTQSAPLCVACVHERTYIMYGYTHTAQPSIRALVCTNAPHTHTHARTHTCKRAHKHARTHTLTDKPHMHVVLFLCTCVNVYLCRAYRVKYLSRYVCVWVYLCVLALYVCCIIIRTIFEHFRSPLLLAEHTKCMAE